MPFWFGKGSRAALEGAPREQGINITIFLLFTNTIINEGAEGEHEGAVREQGEAAREQEGALWGSAGAQQVGA